MKNWLKASAVLVALSANPAFAEETHAGLMSRWYDALMAVDREEVAALLAPEATIELKDICHAILFFFFRWMLQLIKNYVCMIPTLNCFSMGA